jgi:hypothetical protein
LVHDTDEEKKKKKIESLMKIQNAIIKNETVSRMFTSYMNSISDPANELIHLFEIRDAIHIFFGNKSKATKALSFDEEKWVLLGNICNGLPLKQGRHRGRTKPKLRDATEQELEQARSISKEMIELMVEYLNNNP